MSQRRDFTLSMEIQQVALLTVKLNFLKNDACAYAGRILFLVICISFTHLADKLICFLDIGYFFNLAVA